MLKKTALLLSLLLWQTQVVAFPCFFTLVKGDCWTPYAVTVDIMTAITNQKITTITATGKSTYQRVQLDCKPGLEFYYTASFSPNIWTGDTQKTYRSKHVTLLPEAPEITQAAWNINICFPDAFSEVPIPLDATSANCPCHFKDLPPVTVEPKVPHAS